MTKLIVASCNFAKASKIAEFLNATGDCILKLPLEFKWWFLLTWVKIGDIYAQKP
jgi:hypothetical protein